MFAITSAPRPDAGKGHNRRLRAAGKLPAVLYGHGLKEAIPLAIDPKEVTLGLAQPKGVNALFAITVEGQTYQALIGEVQRHPLTRKALHVDFVVHDLEKPITVNVPISFEGRAVGEALGGRLQSPYRELLVRCLPAEIPAALVVDITNLELDDQLHVTEIEMPDGVEALYDRDFMVAKMVQPRGLTAEEEGEEAEGEEGEEAEGEEGGEATEGDA